MGILSELAEKLLNNFLSLKEDDWIQWIAQENDWKDDCDKFGDCYFIVKQMPKYPQHLKCQCRLKKIEKPIPKITARATVDIRKFTEYIFSDKYVDGKKELFESWGYTIDDSEYLRILYISQALKEYCNGNYKYLGTNDFCVKISIQIVIKNETEKEQIVNTVWGLGKEGELMLITPYSGHSY